jgi:hypothetical protein
MSDLTIKTNNVPRDVLCWWDLTKKEQAEFDYLDSEGRQNEAQFFRYKKWVYDLGEFVRVVPRSDLVGMQKTAARCWAGTVYVRTVFLARSSSSGRTTTRASPWAWPLANRI